MAELQAEAGMTDGADGRSSRSGSDRDTAATRQRIAVATGTCPSTVAEAALEAAHETPHRPRP